MSSIKIPIETSARHVHMSREDFEQLFGKGAELTFVKELSQPAQFLAKERVTVRGPRGEFENVAILGPFRKETQVHRPAEALDILHLLPCRMAGAYDPFPYLLLRSAKLPQEQHPYCFDPRKIHEDVHAVKRHPVKLLLPVLLIPERHGI